MSPLSLSGTLCKAATKLSVVLSGCETREVKKITLEGTASVHRKSVVFLWVAVSLYLPGGDQRKQLKHFEGSTKNETSCGMHRERNILMGPIVCVW